LRDTDLEVATIANVVLGYLHLVKTCLKLGLEACVHGQLLIKLNRRWLVGIPRERVFKWAPHRTSRLVSIGKRGINRCAAVPVDTPAFELAIESF